MSQDFLGWLNPDFRKILCLSIALLAAYSFLYLYLFPNVLDTVSHYGTVELALREGFVRYTTLWYGGSPLLTVYSLGFLLAYIPSLILGGQAGYVLVEFAALIALCAGILKIGDAALGQQDKRHFLLFLFLASPAFFYLFIRLDRFPTLTGAAIGVFAIARALNRGTRLDWKGMAKQAALLALATMASVHVGLIAGIVTAAMWGGRILGGKEGGGFAKHSIAVGAAILTFSILEASHAYSVYQFSQYVNPQFYFGFHPPVVALSWFGPLAVAGVAWLFAKKIAERFFGNGKKKLGIDAPSARRIAIISFAAVSAAAFVAMGWGARFEQTLLIAELVLFIAAFEFLLARSVPRLSFAFDENLAFAAFFFAASVTRSFFIPPLKTLNPQVYVLFASLFLCVWLAKRFDDAKGAVPPLVLAMAVISIPITTIMAPAYFPPNEGISEFVSYLKASPEFGRVLYSNCTSNYYYVTAWSGKPAASGFTFYTQLDPLVREYDMANGEGPAKLKMIRDSELKIKWVVSCNPQEDFSPYGFARKMSFGGLSAISTLWERPEKMPLVEGTDGARADYLQNGNRIEISGSMGGLAKVNLGYYPVFACENCTIEKTSGRAVWVRLDSQRAALYVNDPFQWQLAASALVALLVILLL